MKHDYAVVLGRFSPFHIGHLDLIMQAFEVAPRVIIVLGSSNSASNTKNPWDTAVRMSMIFDALPKDKQSAVSFVQVRDYLYSDERWTTEVNNVVHSVAGYSGSIALVGYHKDASSYYLRLFEGWHFVHASPRHKVDATDIRKLLFEGKNYAHLIPPSVADHLALCQQTEKFKDLQAEHSFLKAYKASWASSPFPPMLVTTDCVLTQANHVLVIKRGGYPGKGLYALPGGFLQGSETLEDCMLRELIEETNIVFPKEDLRSAIVKTKVFDAPGRDERGRTITHAHHIKLNNRVVPQVTGGDDASHSMWMPINDVYAKEHLFYSDHAQIIDYFWSNL